MLNYLMNFAYKYSDYSSSSLDYGTSAATGAAGAAVILGSIGFIFLLAAIPTILMIVAQWKIFKKCGEEGWKAIIPIYNVITLLNIVKIKPLWVIALFIPFLNGLAGLLLGIIVIIRLCKGFGKSDGFIIGTILLSLVFQLILAFDKSTWDPSKIDLNSFSFLNDDNAAAAPAAGAKKAEGEAPKTTPEDPWVKGEK